ncbi:hypothetical protein ACHAXS_007828 [Conticribra weissflogii]
MDDDEPVIISEKDFTPTPSASPVPEDIPATADATLEAIGEKAEGEGDIANNLNDESAKTKEPVLDNSIVVSDDEGGDGGGKNDEDGRSNDADDDEESNDDSATADSKTVTHDGGIAEPKLTDETPAEAAPATKIDQPEILQPKTTPEETAAEEPTKLPAAVPSARQIVSIGSATDSYAFTFHEEELNAILAKIPPGWKVSVVSVVGAFRTGKSFLLSWFLRYLERHCVKKGGSSVSCADDDADNKEWYERVQTLNQHEGSFDWRGGTARNTTGMWMWSDPYFLPRSSGEDVAVLLVDTQGMFDHETTVGLTAAIFGLSTLLSSYQIYNVDKRIQEDNLQQLALFSEYGRMAFEAEEKATAAGVIEAEEAAENTTKETSASGSKKVAVGKEPFQRIEFLVRDWQNFDTEDETDIASMEKEMSEYLEHVLAERAASDLKETREQIHSCFKEVSCFMMTHPGFAVIKNKYEGDVSKIDGLFLRLLGRYCERVFSSGRLQPKTVRGRELSAVELGTYIKSYALMFEEIGANFPKAETLLEATTKANNANAVNASVEAYTEVMNAVAGPQADSKSQYSYNNFIVHSSDRIVQVRLFSNNSHVIPLFRGWGRLSPPRRTCTRAQAG